MLQLIISALHKENIAVWRIKKTESCRSELYFIKKDLDIPRFAKINEYQEQENPELTYWLKYSKHRMERP